MLFKITLYSEDNNYVYGRCRIHDDFYAKYLCMRVMDPTYNYNDPKKRQTFDIPPKYENIPTMICI